MRTVTIDMAEFNNIADKIHNVDNNLKQRDSVAVEFAVAELMQAWYDTKIHIREWYDVDTRGFNPQV